jgi:hypothetical protein
MCEGVGSGQPIGMDLGVAVGVQVAARPVLDPQGGLGQYRHKQWQQSLSIYRAQASLTPETTV